MVAEFDRVRDRPRLQAQPVFGVDLDHQGSCLIEVEHGAIEQLLVAGQGDGHLEAGLAFGAKSASRQFPGLEEQDVDLAMVREMVDPLG